MKNVTSIFAVAITILLFSPLSAEEYYADSVNGNDSHDGLAPERAFRTIDKASRMLQAGDTLHLKAGCVFKEEVHFPVLNNFECRLNSIMDWRNYIHRRSACMSHLSHLSSHIT